MLSKLARLRCVSDIMLLWMLPQPDGRRFGPASPSKPPVMKWSVFRLFVGPLI